MLFSHEQIILANPSEEKRLIEVALSVGAKYSSEKAKMGPADY